MEHSPSASNHPSLQPIRLGSTELRNRVVQSATVSNLGRNRDVTDELTAFYVERARGGVGAIVTEGLSVHPTSIPNGTVPLAYDPALIGGFTRMADAVHEHGAALFGQLWHVGRQALWTPGLIPWAPSEERDAYSGSTPHVMTDAEILELVDGFKTAAGNLVQAGFDGVELHGAHGYLISQFLSPLSNRRDDRWGGSLENRCRFAVELIRGLREVVPDSFVVGIKLPVHEYIEGGLTIEDAEEIAAHLSEVAPPDYFGTGQGNFSPSLEKHVPDLHFPDLPFIDLARRVRAAANGVPVMAISKIPDVDAADKVISDGSADLVGMTRALLADPHLVRKALSGEPARPCVYCNVCWEFIHTGRVVSCIYEPVTGRESEAVEPVPSGAPLRVEVIGAGPAGLEFARVALQYGHAVRVHEASQTVGGRLRAEASVPGREVFDAAADWMANEVRRLGGEIITGDRVDIGSTNADGLVVLATGATPIVDDLPGAQAVMSLEEALSASDQLAGPVVVVDEIEGEPVYGAAEAIASTGVEVTIVTRRASIGRRVSYINMIGVLRRLDLANIAVHTSKVANRVENGELIVSHALSGRESSIGPVGTIVRAGPYRSTINSTDVPAGVVTVGDASGPRDILPVVREANLRAHALFSPPAKHSKSENAAVESMS